MGSMESDKQLLKNIKDNFKTLTDLKARCDAEGGSEDGIYRFYHHSFKAYSLQSLTVDIFSALKALNPFPGTSLNSMFETIIVEGTGKVWQHQHNLKWVENVKPIVDAYFHAKWMLDMVVKYGDMYTYPPHVLATGWAGVLYLYNIR